MVPCRFGHAHRGRGGVNLCLPCYVDVLEEREAGGVMGAETRSTLSAPERGTPTPESDELPGNSPPPFRQLDLFD